MEISLTFNPKRRQRVFLATADSAIQQEMQFWRNELVYQIKLLLLLGNEVVAGAPFYWQSLSTREAFNQLAPVIEARLFTLMGRPGIWTSKEYLAERLADTEVLKTLRLPDHSAFLSEIPPPTASEYAKVLDQLAPLLPRKGSVEQSFKRLFLSDLNLYSPPRSSMAKWIRDIFPIEFSMSSRRHAELLMSRLGELPFGKHFSRASIEACIVGQEVPPGLLESINLRSIALFHSANAEACEAKLFTWEPFAEDLPESTPYCDQLSLSPDNPYLLGRVLAGFGVSRRVIEQLNAKDLIALASGIPEIVAFINWYKSFLNKVLIVETHGKTFDHQADQLLQAIKRHRSINLQRSSRLRKIRSLQNRRFHWFVGCISAIAGIVFHRSILDIGITAWRSIAGTKEALNFLKDRCERAVTKPIGDFEAFVIGQGLVDLAEDQSGQESTRKGMISGTSPNTNLQSTD